MTEDLRQKQVEAYYMLLLKSVGRTVYVPIPLRNQPIPSKEDYENSVAIWQQTKDFLTMIDIKHTWYADRLGIRIEK